MKTGFVYLVSFEIGLIAFAFILLGLFGLDAFVTYETAKAVYLGLQYFIPIVFVVGVWRQRRTAKFPLSTNRNQTAAL